MATSHSNKLSLSLQVQQRLQLLFASVNCTFLLMHTASQSDHALAVLHLGLQARFTEIVPNRMLLFVAVVAVAVVVVF
jgi:hypothetical protein